MIPRFRAWNKATKAMYEVEDIMSIDFEKSEISVKTLFFERENYYKELFGDIAKFVFNNYDWAAELDEDIDRIARKYRSKEGLGRNKPAVKHYLYRAYTLGV